MTLAELQFARKLLDQGVPLEVSTIRRVVDHAIDLAVRVNAQQHGPAAPLDLALKEALTK